MISTAPREAARFLRARTALIASGPVRSERVVRRGCSGPPAAGVRVTSCAANRSPGIALDAGGSEIAATTRSGRRGVSPAAEAASTGSAAPPAPPQPRRSIVSSSCGPSPWRDSAGCRRVVQRPDAGASAGTTAGRGNVAVPTSVQRGPHENEPVSVPAACPREGNSAARHRPAACGPGVAPPLAWPRPRLQRRANARARPSPGAIHPTRSEVDTCRSRSRACCSPAP